MKYLLGLEAAYGLRRAESAHFSINEKKVSDLFYFSKVNSKKSLGVKIRVFFNFLL